VGGRGGGEGGPFPHSLTFQHVPMLRKSNYSKLYLLLLQSINNASNKLQYSVYAVPVQYK
jgi:hypothetical protein